MLATYRLPLYCSIWFEYLDYRRLIALVVEDNDLTKNQLKTVTFCGLSPDEPRVDLNRWAADLLLLLKSICPIFKLVFSNEYFSKFP